MNTSPLLALGADGTAKAIKTRWPNLLAHVHDLPGGRRGLRIGLPIGDHLLHVTNALEWSVGTVFWGDVPRLNTNLAQLEADIALHLEQWTALFLLTVRDTRTEPQMPVPEDDGVVF